MNIWGEYYILSLIMVALKKIQFVESHELGIVDTLLQIGITWSLSLFLLGIIKYLKKIEVIKKMILVTGGVSYELYLAHALPLDCLNSK